MLYRFLLLSFSCAAIFGLIFGAAFDVGSVSAQSNSTVAADGEMPLREPLTNTQLDLVRFALRPTSVVTEDLHNLFWGDFDEDMLERFMEAPAELEAWRVSVREMTLMGLLYQEALFQSVILSIEAGFLVRTDSYDSYRLELMATRDPSILESVRISEELLEHAVSGETYSTARGPVVISVQMAENTLRTLEISIQNVEMLLDPVWRE